MKIRIALLFVLAVSIMVLAWLGTGKKRFCAALKASCSGANGVVLERYYSGTVLQSAEMSGDEFRSWMDQLPKGPGWLRHTFTKCWVPHHRIHFGGGTEVEICFSCDEIWTKETGRRKIPGDWVQPLRAMFLAHDIPDAAPDWKEQIRFLDAMGEQDESEGDGGKSGAGSKSKPDGDGEPHPDSEKQPQ